MVSQWTAMITRTDPESKPLPQMIKYALDLGMSDGENMMRQCGMVFEPPDMINTPAKDSCAVCTAAVALHSK